MLKEPEKRSSKRKMRLAALAVTVMALGVFTGTTAIWAMDDQAEDGSLSVEQEKKLEAFQKTYHAENQSKAAKQLEKKKKENEYTVDNMLIQYNPFGTNTQSAYVYFKTDYAAKVSYTVSVSGKDIGDFTQEAHQAKEYQREHEFQVIGLIPGRENKVKFTITDEKGMVTTRTYAYNMGSLLGDEKLQLETDVDKEDMDKLSDGLFAVLGNDDSKPGFLYYYDNAGVLRGEVPLLGARSPRLLFHDGTMFYSISETQMAAVNRLGQVTAVYDLGDYKLHHDYVFDDDGNILFLATDSKKDSVEDVVAKLDTASGQVSEVLDLGNLLGNYKTSCVKNADGNLDWIHINTIQWMGNGQVLLSSGETSSIIKVSSLYGAPRIDYMIGAGRFWSGTGYEGLLLAKQDDFTIQGGQHSITYETDSTLKEGQYYLYMFNNNIGSSETRPDFGWASTGLAETGGKEGGTSYYYKYLVDEKNRTFQLADSFKVPYSGYAGSVQDIDGNTVSVTGGAGVFAEYDKGHNLIASYRLRAEKSIYRVYKYPFH